MADPSLAASAVAADPMIPTPYRVLARRWHNDDTATLSLAPVDVALPPPRPGQFFMLWAPGVGEVPISIGGRADGGVIEETVRVVGAVSRALAEAPEGAVLGVRGPYGRPWDLDATRGHDVVVVAGGMGLVPLRPAILELLDRLDAGRDEGARRLSVVVGARTPTDLLLQDELAVWGDRADVTVLTTVDRADRSWHGHVGVVTEVLDQLDTEPTTATALVCGPEIMMRFTAQALEAMGMPRTAIQLSLERNMKCAIGHCGHCQLGDAFVCLDGPVVTADRALPLMRVRER